MKYLGITLEILLNSLILSFVAAMIRVLFTKIDSFGDTMKIFLGSILFGVIIGYVMNDFVLFKPYLKLIVVIFSIFGKELYIWMEKLFSDPGKNISVVLSFVNAIKSIKIGFSHNKSENDSNIN